jgi:AraC family transcriptional regulator, regulatory protein of adaptative response / methylated-DNA-[protein]-cysteine methyltransferase
MDATSKHKEDNMMQHSRLLTEHLQARPEIRVGCYASPLGHVLIGTVDEASATTATSSLEAVTTSAAAAAVCLIALYDNPVSAEVARAEVLSRYPDAELVWGASTFHDRIMDVLGNWGTGDRFDGGTIPVKLRGTAFQRKVWAGLCAMEIGEQKSYGELASRVGHPAAVRAVGTAVGQNPVSVLIPCHRIVRADGAIGQYHWGSDRKKHLLGLESGTSSV